MRWLLIDFLAAVRDYAPTNPDQYVVEQAKEVATRNRMDKRPPHRSDSEQKSSFAGETPAYIRIVPGIFFVFCRSDPRGTAVAVFAVCYYEELGISGSMRCGEGGTLRRAQPLTIPPKERRSVD